jgi:hypothetical protein
LAWGILEAKKGQRLPAVIALSRNMAHPDPREFDTVHSERIRQRPIDIGINCFYSSDHTNCSFLSYFYTQLFQKHLADADFYIL